AKLYGSPLTPPQPFLFGNPLVGTLGLLFSWNHGVFPFAPVGLLALFFWRRFFRDFGREAALFAGGFFFYFTVMAFFNCWWGGWCYGPRLISPVLAFGMVPIFYLPRTFSSWSGTLR